MISFLIFFNVILIKILKIQKKKKVIDNQQIVNKKKSIDNKKTIISNHNIDVQA